MRIASRATDANIFILAFQVSVDDVDVDGKELSDVNGMLSGGMEGSLLQLGMLFMRVPHTLLCYVWPMKSSGGMCCAGVMCSTHTHVCMSA